MRLRLGFGTAQGRRRWRRGLGGGLLAAVLLVAAAPYLLSWTPLANVSLRAASWRIKGRATVGEASLGWFSPPALRDLEVRPHEGPPLIKAPSVSMDRTLWQIVTGGDLGQVRLERPELHLLLRKDGSNLEDLLGRRLQPETPADEPDTGSKPAQRQVRDVKRKTDVRLVDARIVWRTPASEQEWNVEGINLAFGLQPPSATSSGLPELVVKRGTVLDHCRITPGMCNDVLRLVAPILNRAPHVAGEFSIELDDWRLPLEAPEKGELGGRLSLHEVVAGPGSFARELADRLHVNVPEAIELARESVVRFELIDGRIDHRDLEFRLPPLRVRTSGSVGFDDTLEVLAEVTVELPEEITAVFTSARELTQKTLRIPITGTLSKPRIGTSAMGDTDLARAIEKLQNLGVSLTEPKNSPDADHAGRGHTAQQDKAVELLEDLAQKWSKRRQKDKGTSGDNEQPPDGKASDEETPTEAAAQKALDRVLDRVRKLKK